MTFELDIDGLNILICEYIGIDCKEYLKFINKIEKYEYLYIEYTVESKIWINNIRYLREVTNLGNLIKYNNLLFLTFGKFFNQEIEQNIFPNSLQQITVHENYKYIIQLENICKQKNIKLRIEKN